MNTSVFDFDVEIGIRNLAEEHVLQHNVIPFAITSKKHGLLQINGTRIEANRLQALSSLSGGSLSVDFCQMCFDVDFDVEIGIRNRFAISLE